MVISYIQCIPEYFVLTTEPNVGNSVQTDTNINTQIIMGGLIFWIMVVSA